MTSDHNPVKASGLLFAYLAGISQRTTPERAQVWQLNAANPIANATTEPTMHTRYVATT